MINKLGIHDFDIDQSTIPPEIEVLHNSLSNLHKKQLEKHYASAHDFLVILFYLRFVERLQISAIAEKLHLHPTNVDLHLYDFAWNYSSDYIENQCLSKEFLIKAKDALLEAKEKSHLLDENVHTKLNVALVKVKGISEKSYVILGFETREEYARVFYYLVYCKDFSAKMLCHLFHLTYSSVHLRLQKLGLNVSVQEGTRKKQKRGSQNYEKSIRNGRITQTSSQLQNFSKGSKNEDYFRSQLAKMIYEYIPSQEYEVIVGLSNIGILGRLEIDIPLVVYDIAKNVVHRFAIEYNGNYFHADERDMKKSSLCETKGWRYLDVIERADGRYSNKPELLDPVLRETCEKIKQIVLGLHVPIKV